MEISNFTEKFNELEGVIYTVEEVVTVAGGAYNGTLAHDNINLKTLNVYTGTLLTGTKITDYVISTPSETPWKNTIRVYSSVSPIYISYETIGDKVEAEDINNVQDAIVDTQESLNAEIDRAKLSENTITDNLNDEVIRATNAESDITNLININKPIWDDKYTKDEVLQKINDLINAAPQTLDTLKEIADALGNDPNFSTTIINLLGTKVDKVVGKQLSTEDYTTEEKTNNNNIKIEIENARGTEVSLDARLDKNDVSVASHTTQLSESEAHFNKIEKDISSIQKNVKPEQIKDIDDFSVDNSLYENASNTVDSTVAMDTANKKLTVTTGTGFYKSYKSQKLMTYGRNIIINTILQGGSQAPQIGLRLNLKNTVGSFAWYQTYNNNEFNLFKITSEGGGISTLLSSTFDGSGTGDLDISVRSFNEMTECILRQNGVVVGMLRYIDVAFANLIGINNGLGANGAGVFKKYLKSMELKQYINVICVGDSNTAGNGLTAKSFYPSLLQSRYFDKNVGVVNKGVSGNRVEHVITRLATDVYAQKISGARNIVILQIGTNNASYGDLPATIYNDIKNSLIVPIQEQGFEVWISTIPARDDNASYRANVKLVNELILADISANKVIDFYARTVDASDVTISGLLQADNLHLTGKGTNIFASLIANELGT